MLRNNLLKTREVYLLPSYCHQLSLSFPFWRAPASARALQKYADKKWQHGGKPWYFLLDHENRRFSHKHRQQSATIQGQAINTGFILPNSILFKQRRHQNQTIQTVQQHIHLFVICQDWTNYILNTLIGDLSFMEGKVRGLWDPSTPTMGDGLQQGSGCL